MISLKEMKKKNPAKNSVFQKEKSQNTLQKKCRNEFIGTQFHHIHSKKSKNKKINKARRQSTQTQGKHKIKHPQKRRNYPVTNPSTDLSSEVEKTDCKISVEKSASPPSLVYVHMIMFLIKSLSRFSLNPCPAPLPAIFLYFPS